ncbi:MAG: hypothetical protein DRO88_02065 [Promethearchaeia archaeon]|nr:MAG: hypothetical protein DRO88_02065 [Candidatus Lokiarchaeia archaeon]
MSKSDEKTRIGPNLAITSKEIRDQNISSDILQQRPPSVVVEKILLQNFLSFENEEVVFDPNFTIIIGPNGAGKSSIYQALKFALGSNDYDGRYNKWSDFIHTGAEKAVVQIHIKWNQEEFLIQRVVNQHGAPKFFLKKPNDKKLKNVLGHKIQEFLKKIQIDPNNIFSFMSQGSIDSLKDFKEERLCYFVEKGLGLNVTREQIIEIKRDICRLNKEEQTLLAERENMAYKLAELQPLIEQLKHKKVLTSKLEEVQFELILSQKVDIENKIRDLQHKKLLFLEKVRSYELKIVEIEHQLSQKEQEKQKNSMKYKDLIEKRTQLQERYDQINNQIKEWTVEKNQLALQIQKWEQEIVDLDKDLKQINSELSFQTTKQITIQDQIANIKIKIKDIDEKQRKLEEDMQSYRSSLIKLESEQEIASILHSQIEEYRSNYKTLEQEIMKKIAEIEKIKRNFRQYQWFLKNPTPNLPSLMRQEKKNIEKRLEELQNVLKDLQNQYEEKTHKIDKIKSSIIDKSFPKPRAIKSLLDEVQERKLNCLGPLIDYITYDDIYRSAVESIFGFSVLFSFIAKDRETFHLLTQLVKKHGAQCKIYKERHNTINPLPSITPDPSSGIFGYLAEKIQPINADQAIKKVIYTVANKTLVVKDQLIGEQYIERYHWNFWVVTLDGDQIRPKKLVLEARPRIYNSNRPKFHSVAHAKQEIDKLIAEMEQNRELFSQRELILKKTRRRLVILEDRLRDVDRLVADYKLLEIKTTLKNKAVKDKTELYEKIKAQEQSLQKKEHLISSIKKTLPDSLMEQKNILDQIPQEKEQLMETLEEYRDTLKNLQKSCETSKLRKIQLETRIEDLISQKTQLQTDLQSKDSNFYQLFQQSMQLKKEIQQQKNQETNIKHDLAQIEEDIKDLYRNKQEIATKKEKIQHQSSIINQEITENEEKLNQIQRSLQKVEKLSIPRPIEEIEAEIEYLNHQISLFHVDDSILLEKENLESILDRISEKRQSLQHEIEAAKKSHNKLESIFKTSFSEKIRILQDLTNEKLNHIKQNFSINIKLKGDIESLRLSVTTTTNLNEKPVSFPLHAVSGGQRSLVGICLILYLTHLNPSPLNIYDEMDMFLDEKNAEAIAKLVNTQAQNGIQFILLMPSKNVALLKSANQVIGVSRNGKFGPSSVHYSRIFSPNVG